MSTASMDPPTQSEHSGLPGACMATLDRGLRIISADAALLHTLGGDDSRDVCGTPFTDYLHPSVRHVVRRRLERLVAGQEVRFQEPSVAVVARDAVLSGELDANAFSRDVGRVESIVATLRPSGAPAPAAPKSTRQLSDMDLRILEGVAAGASTHQLAASLFLSRGGIEYHVTALLRKMSVKNRPALVSKAYSMGYFDMGVWPPQVAEADRGSRQ